uniref:G protein pathway suppressor 2-like n=1 Tax=Panthera onca TaxID=9690 RepID=UPI0029540056|nr:G protein pathway suppressor 2-like [Panthera onca]
MSPEKTQEQILKLPEKLCPTPPPPPPGREAPAFSAAQEKGIFPRGRNREARGAEHPDHCISSVYEQSWTVRPELTSSSWEDTASRAPSGQTTTKQVLGPQVLTSQSRVGSAAAFVGTPEPRAIPQPGQCLWEWSSRTRLKAHAAHPQCWRAAQSTTQNVQRSASDQKALHGRVEQRREAAEEPEPLLPTPQVQSGAVPQSRAPSAGGGRRARPHWPAGKRRLPSTQPPQASASRSRSAPPAVSASGTRKPRRSGAGRELGLATPCCNILPPQGKESQPSPKVLGFPAAL